MYAIELYKLILFFFIIIISPLLKSLWDGVKFCFHYY